MSWGRYFLLRCYDECSLCELGCPYFSLGLRRFGNFFFLFLINFLGPGPWSSQVAQMVNICLWCLPCGRPGFNSWAGKISWRRKWQPTPVSLPRNPHGWWNLVGYSPWGRKKLDTTERLHFTSGPYFPLFYFWNPDYSIIYYLEASS